MLWRAVASYLTIVLAAGPGLCCCTTSSVAALAASAGVTHHAPLVPACCCPDQCSVASGLGSSPNKAGDPSGHREDHQPGKHPCPCKDKGTNKISQSQPSPAADPSGQDDVARLLTHGIKAVSVESVPVHPVNPALDSGGGLSPHGHRLTAARLLDLHHQLRC